MLHLKEDLGDKRGNIPRCNKRTNNFMNKPLVKSIRRSQLDKDRRLAGTEKMVGNTGCRTDIRMKLDGQVIVRVGY